MTMHGIIKPVSQDLVVQESLWDRAREKLIAWRSFILVVVIPTLLVSVYYYAVASDQYESEAHFVVSAGGSSSVSPTGFGELLGLGAGSTQSQSAMMSVSDYLRSHDAVRELQQRVNLTAMFRRPGADIVSRLHDDHPTPEALLKYYQSKVAVHYDRDTGITSLEVRAYTPNDSYTIAKALLDLGERRVNEMNERSYVDALAMARHQLAEAEDNTADIQRQVTAYRENHRDIDPQDTGGAQIKLVSELKATLAAAQAQLATMGASIDHASPQYVALARQVRSLTQQVAAQAGTMTGGDSAIATRLGGYEELLLRQQFAGKRYEAAAAALEKARADAQRQQLYLIRVVDANRPVKSLFPQRGKIVLTVLISLVVAYSIGWLIVAGVREHAA